ncbi:MAG: DUF3943 domain-containing protein [Deltaproteobacteria bacterium]|nr:DUF3943 domain-containing protein [Deltaproteobacteria bacterium]
MNKLKRHLILLVLFFFTVIGDGIGRAEDLEDRLDSLAPPNDVIEKGKPGDENGSEKEYEKDPGLKEFLLDTVYHYGFLWAGRFFYVRNKDDRIFDTSFSKWIDNITKAPVWNDEDAFDTNFIIHPLFGAEYYLFYRARGHSVWASALGSFVQSALFEYAIEGLVETPSLPDLIFTPAIGTPFGIVLENLSDWLVERDNSAAKVAGHFVNPMRIFFKDTKFGILNPLTGAFAFQGPFSITPNKSRSFELSYPFFLEPPIPVGRVVGSFEVVDLDKKVGGQFIFYSIRVDFSSSDNRYGVYLKYPYSGVNNVTVNGVEIDNGFEFSNLLIGGKFLIVNSEDFSISGGLEVIPPTAFKDNKDRLKTVDNYGRDFPLYLASAVTVSPYISAAVKRRQISLLGSLGVDLIFNADKFEEDNFETRIKYASAVGAEVPVLASPSLFVEFNGYTLVTANTIEKTDIFLTPGLRFGKRYSPGFGVQIPLTGRSADIANASFIVDFQVRF